MKKFLIAAIFVSLTAAASEPLWKKLYFRADGGLGFPQNTKNTEFKNAAIYGGGIGFRFNEMFRFDINYNHRAIKSKLKNAGVPLQKQADINTIFVNGYFNLTDFEEMTPYLTAGLGYTTNKTQDSYYDKGNIRTVGKGTKKQGVAWNVGVGTTYALHKNVDIDLGYRFANLGEVKFANIQQKLISTNTALNTKFTADSRNILSHELMFGVIIKL